MIKHFTATGVLVTNGTPKKILLGLHNKLGVWLPPGGHIEEAENPTEGLIREVLEETGCNIIPYLPKQKKLEDRVTQLVQPDFILEEVIPARGDNPEHCHLDLCYCIVVPEFTPVFPEHEYSKMHWFTKKAALQLKTFANIKEFFIPRVL